MPHGSVSLSKWRSSGSYTSNGNIYHMVDKDNAKLNVASVAYCLVEVLIKDKHTGHSES